LTAGPSGLPFLSKGSHKIVSACSLPLGLPQSVIGLMNIRFGKQLRREIVQLLNKAEAIHPCSYSTGSDALSAGSREMPNGDFANESDNDQTFVYCNCLLEFLS